MKIHNLWFFKKIIFDATFLLFSGVIAFSSYKLQAAPPPYPLPIPLPAFKKTKAPHQASNIEPSYRELISLKIQTQTPGSMELLIQNKLDLKMVAYQRGNCLYIFFDKDVLFNIKDIEGSIQNFIQNLEQVSLPKGSLLKIVLIKEIKVSTLKDGYGWVLNFFKNKSSSSLSSFFPIKIQEPFISESRLTFNLPNVGAPIFYKDPLVHDTLILFPTQDNLKSKELDLPKLKFIQTIQGVALSTVSKDLKVQQTESLVTLDLTENLNLSSPEDRHLTRTLTEIPLLFRFKPKTQNYDQFYDQERKLLYNIINQQDVVDKAQARFKAARFYLSHWMLQEALGLLMLIQHDTPQVAQKNFIQAYLGLIQGLTGRLSQAQQTFQHSQLNEELEVKLWQGIFDLDQGNQESGLKDILTNINCAKFYPSEVQNYIYLKAAEAALDTQQPAQNFIDNINKSLLSLQEKEELKYIQALNLKASHDHTQAIEAFKKLSQSSHLRVRTLAVYQLSLLLQDTTANLATLVQMLEEHRSNWRGDGVEIKLLQQLAQLYFKNNQIPEGLRILKQLILYYPKTTAALDAKTLAETIIYKNLTENNHLSAFQRLAFYTEFQKYLPQDERKDKIFQILGESYLDLNLVDKAEKIFLSLLPVYKEDVETQGQLLLKLAQAQIKEGKPEKAFETLDSINRLALKNSETLFHQKQIQAKILTQRQDYDGALALLEDIPSQEALYQKTDIATAAKKWPKVIEYLEALVSMKSEKRDLTPDIILNLATAYYHGRQPSKLKDLRQKYLSFMLKSPLAATFSLITDTNEAVKTTPEDLTQQLQNTKEFDQHLKNYLKNMSPAS